MASLLRRKVVGSLILTDVSKSPLTALLGALLAPLAPPSLAFRDDVLSEDATQASWRADRFAVPRTASVLGVAWVLVCHLGIMPPGRVK